MKRKMSKKQFKTYYIMQQAQRINLAINQGNDQKAAQISAEAYVKNIDNMDDFIWLCPTTKIIHTADQDCNLAIKNSAIDALNWRNHQQIERKLLKQYYLKKQVISWQAIVADISYPTKNNPHTHLLLNHVLMSPSNMFYHDFNVKEIKDLIIDYHCWLPLDHIYQLPQDKQEMQVGDLIFGTSSVVKYKNRHGQTKYGLGSTKITHCGVIIQSEHNLISLPYGSCTVNTTGVDSTYQRDHPIVKIRYNAKRDLLTRSYRNLYSFNFCRQRLVDFDFYPNQNDRYFEILTQSQTRRDRIQRMKKLFYKQAIKLISDQKADEHERALNLLSHYTKLPKYKYVNVRTRDLIKPTNIDVYVSGLSNFDLDND